MTARTQTIWTFVVTSLGLFMVVLDNLVVSTALPVIRTDLGASIQQLEWTVNAYTLTFAVLLVTGGRLGDIFGRRRIFLTGVCIFAAASATIGLAPSEGWLVASRAVQGVGSALMMPGTLSIISNAFPPQERGRAIGTWAGVSAIALGLGPVLGVLQRAEHAVAVQLELAAVPLDQRRERALVACLCPFDGHRS